MLEKPMLKKNIVLCVTGGIAAFKSVLLLRLLTKAGADVRVVMTESATRFIGPLTFEALSNHAVLTNLWQTGGKGGESHIQLAEWADAIVVVPATANTLARMVHGFADDLIAATLLAARGPVVVAPAMHHRMWGHPATQSNVETLRARGVTVVFPTEGELASGHGQGRLAEPEQILEALMGVLSPPRLKGLKVVVTAGPTVESLDPVRFISNHSTGKMGYALARVAHWQGAEVTLISGPSRLSFPTGVKAVSVTSAQAMFKAVEAAYPDADVVIMSAAVADYTPAVSSDEKLKKKDSNLMVELVPTVDILATLGARRKFEGRGPVLIGFAMETSALEEHAAGKLERKGCDMIVANNLKEAGAGFGHDTNRVTLISRGIQAGSAQDEGAAATAILAERLPLMSKEGVAEAVLGKALELHAQRLRKGLNGAEGSTT